MQNHKLETNSELIYEDGSIWSTLIFIKIIGSDTLIPITIVRGPCSHDCQRMCQLFEIPGAANSCTSASLSMLISEKSTSLSEFGRILPSTVSWESSIMSSSSDSRLNTSSGFTLSTLITQGLEGKYLSS